MARLTVNVDSPRGGRGARRKSRCAREHRQVVGGGDRQLVEGVVVDVAGHCQRLLVTGRERGPPSGPGEGEVVGGLRGGDVARHGLGLPHDEQAVATDGGLRCGRDTTVIVITTAIIIITEGRRQCTMLTVGHLQSGVTSFPLKPISETKVIAGVLRERGDQNTPKIPPPPHPPFPPK